MKIFPKILSYDSPKLFYNNDTFFFNFRITN